MYAILHVSDVIKMEQQAKVRNELKHHKFYIFTVITKATPTTVCRLQ